MSRRGSTDARRLGWALAGCGLVLGSAGCESEVLPVLPEPWIRGQEGVLVFLERGEGLPFDVVAHDLDGGPLHIVPEPEIQSVRVHVYDTPLSTYLDALGPQKHVEDGRPIPFTAAQYAIELDGEAARAWRGAEPAETISEFRLRGPGACTSFDTAVGGRVRLDGPVVAVVSSARMGIPSMVLSSETLDRAEVGLELSAQPLGVLALPPEVPPGLELRTMKAHTIGRTHYLTDGWFIREGDGSIRARRFPYGDIAAGDASAGVANFYNFIVARNGDLYLHQENEDEWTLLGTSEVPLADGALAILTGEGSLSFAAVDTSRRFVFGSPSALSQGELEIEGSPVVLVRLAGALYVVSDRGEVLESSSDGQFRLVFSIPVAPQRVSAAVAFHRGLASTASWFLGLDDGSIVEYRPDGRLCPPIPVLTSGVGRLIPRLAAPGSTVVEELLVVGALHAPEGAEVARLTARR